MTRRSPLPGSAAEWPFHLRQIIRAAERECPRGHAKALADLTALALVKVPSRGILDPTSRGEHEMFGAIEVVANRHLGLARARTDWQRALRRARIELEARDEVERAALAMQGISDTAYFYAGLTFGLSSVALHGSR